MPHVRIHAVNEAATRPSGDYVLYWMTAFRRWNSNFALQRAVEWAQALSRPLVILEALRCDYRWASDRLHAFALEGMADNAHSAAGRPVLYYPYVEAQPGAGRGLLAALASRACVVVADDAPAFFLPHMVAAAAQRLQVRLEAVDSNGLLPLRAATRVFSTAHSFRAWLQRNLAPHLAEWPAPDPLADVALPALRRLPDAIEASWPRASQALLRASTQSLASLPLDHSVSPAALHGGHSAARQQLDEFVLQRLPGYLERNDPDPDVASHLSSWLHWGHVSAHEVFAAVAKRERWSPARLAGPLGGHRAGWWQMSPEAEAFLDQLVTWRELGFNMSSKRSDANDYATLPGWARASLAQHADDPRPHLYSLEELEAARTADPVWNAAQNQLVRTGSIHNYLRMLWGKRVLEWTRKPEEAFRILEHLNNKYALDGRDPNSYSGILWVFGRYDRAWGPERPIFGKVRYMSSDSARRKLHLKRYLAEYAGAETGR